MPVTIEELKAFLSKNPPRPVPGTIRREAMKRAPLAVVLIGLLFGGFGVPFTCIFFPHRLPQDLALNAAGRSVPDAVVVAEEQTGMSENDHQVVRYEFSFRTPAGVGVTGACYRTGASFSLNQTVTAEYLPGSPSVARIKGCRLSPFGWGGGFVVIFPIVGFTIASFGWRSRRRLRALLSAGLFGAGRITSVDTTNVTVNNKPMYRVTVSFRAGGGDVTTTYSAYGADVDLARRKQQGGETVGLLYDPDDPQRVFLVDALVG